MSQDMKILANRKGYEFAADCLHLSLIATRPVMDHIQQLFQFQLVTIGSPMPTFGNFLQAFPPGVIFDHGVALATDNRIAPIRFLHFEPQRIVIDATGESPAIDAIFQTLLSTINELHTTNGLPIIGTPERVLCYSEIVTHLSFPFDAITASPLQHVLRKTMHTPENGQGPSLLPSLVLTFPAKKTQHGNLAEENNIPFTLGMRTGTQPEELIYFSSAPLDAETHLTYLNELEIALTSL